jgi:hypothetical protein
MMGNHGPSVGGAIVAGGAAIVEAPYFIVKGVHDSAAAAGNWLGDSVYRWTH